MNWKLLLREADVEEEEIKLRDLYSICLLKSTVLMVYFSYSICVQLYSLFVIFCKFTKDYK